MANIRLFEIKLDQAGNKSTVLLDIGKQRIEKTISDVINFLCQGGKIERAYIENNELRTVGATNRGFKDMTGIYCGEYGEWIEIIEYLGNNHWRCKCTCGTIKSVQGSQLRNHTTKSCGHTVTDDLLGKTFGFWHVNKYVGNQSYECTCTCGCDNVTKIIRKYHLESGVSKSCGRLTTGLKNYIDYQFNDWTVISYNKELQRWLCKCTCGTPKYLTTQVISRQATNNCGCKRKKNFHDLEKTQFGQWTVLKELPGYQSGRTHYLCECSCGRQRIVNSQHLMLGSSISCGNCSKTDEQLEVLRSAEKFKKFIVNTATALGSALTLFDIADLLEVSTGTVYRLLNKYDAWCYIDRYVQRSKFEDDILTYVKTIENTAVITNARLLPNNQELDIYVSTKHLAIEANGTYWHSTYKKSADYHQIKTKNCITKGIQLLHIFEYEWNDETTQRKLKNLIKNRLGYVENIIYAKDTKIERIDNSITNQFLNDYHLQGAVNAEICYGLYLNNLLVEVMTFGHSRFTTEADYELLRLCTLPDYLVAGGAGKLFSKFKTDFPTCSVVTYCDLTKFSGKVYENLGMTFETYTAPNYVYVDRHNNVLSRYQCTKKKLVELNYGTEEQTEEEIMLNRNYFKIYNSGNARYIYRPSRK